MKIVVAVRCYNEEKNIERFLRGYDFADHIVISDGGSRDNSLPIIQRYASDKVRLIHFHKQETINGYTWNPDSPHMNYVLDAAKEMKPDWLIFDDMDCVPNRLLRENIRPHFKWSSCVQIDIFRLYLWGDDQYFPFMNRDFDINYTSLWAWQPGEVDIRADPNIHHGTLIGLHKKPCKFETPWCLLHKSWCSETIDAKVERQNAVGIQMGHPFTFAGKPEPLPEWARE